jgi:hypothetical protein
VLFQWQPSWAAAALVAFTAGHPLPCSRLAGWWLVRTCLGRLVAGIGLPWRAGGCGRGVMRVAAPGALH